MTDKKIALSFIVPVYNVEKYIAQCLASILKINKISIEVIVVDDASPDNSMAIVREKFANDSRLKIIHLKENRGLSEARNEGIRQARGDYIAFIDSDDFIQPEIIEIAYSYILKEKPDVLASNGYMAFDDDTLPNKISVPVTPLKYSLTSGADFYKDRFINNKLVVAAPAYIYKKSFLSGNRLFFIAGLLHEDEVFYPQWCAEAKKVLDLPVIFYYYRKRAISITAIPVEERLPHLKKVIYLLDELQRKTKNKAFAYYLGCYNANLAFHITHLSGIKDKELKVWGKQFLKIQKHSIRSFVLSILHNYFPTLRIYLSRFKQKFLPLYRYRTH